ncbi:MAG: DUF3500 domain-containing protein [Planctomycetaceae bacterium]
MQTRSLWIATLVAVLTASGGWSWFREASIGDAMSDAAGNFVGLLNEAQRSTAVMPYADKRRVDWHFIPKDARKGLTIKEMTESQRAEAHKLLQAALSEIGYEKATKIMSLEKLLFVLEGAKRKWPRDWEQYYFTLFGDPTGNDRWGLSVEGHHLSLNFVVERGKVISTTPQAMASNPAVVKTANEAGVDLGTRLLAQEELLAFELVNSLDDEQRKAAIVDQKAPKEVRAAGEPQPPQEAPIGIAAGKLTSEQQATLRKLIDEYARAMPESVARQRWDEIEQSQFSTVHFAWAGPLEPGIGHYYRIQGTTFVIEFVNTQPDAAGNPANHIHCLWRDLRGDFAVTLKQ